MFEKVTEANFIGGEHGVLRYWQENKIFEKLRKQNIGKPVWSFLDGPITANNPMGVHHAWGRTYKDAYQRYFAMTGHRLRYQNGFDCQGLWVEVEVERELGFSTKKAIVEHGIENFVNACKQRVLRFAARQTEQSIRLGFWMDWDHPDQLRGLANSIGTGEKFTLTTPQGEQVTAPPHQLISRLGNPEWGGSYFTFSTENNETIWSFLKKCHERGKIYRGHDVMPWSGRAGSAYSQMEVADGRRLSVHKAVFVRFRLKDRENEYLLVWTTTPWTLTSNVAAAINPELDYARLRSKRDAAVYYFAADNLDYQRLGREYKMGFGRPEWSWPTGVPKLKTIAQIFKEQGGFEVEEKLKGVELIGWEYEGPFDELEAQRAPGGFPADEKLGHLSGMTCHRVIDGGRDSKGQPHVVVGEGTGIVHIAPGCGDVDHQLGDEQGIVGIAPLTEDGRFTKGFGEFTGHEAIDVQTTGLVFEKLREKHLLVATEDYPHIYPHCWRTGDELVFRLVDEWFINMDWREEIKDVTRKIRWLPNNVDGQQRELEWLTNMRDWMISKKRFWGLALPIWVDPEDGDFEVIGSLDELRDRAIEGWDDFEGNTPHRPWIDRVKIRNPRTGNLMNRVEDVGNPWLDAGIVSFSTMHYNSDREEWARWYPADLVTECFPGQFRNWFYSLLAMATMMDNSPPFKTLLGHRLVMNEDGEPMHKSDGTAIWFEEAAEQLGVDTMRWLYLAQNPAADLRFGTRHVDEPVAIETVDGPVAETKEGMPICRVSSKPSDEIRRQVLIPLWNSYTFFVNYAILDEFNPRDEQVPINERPEIDRWILSNLQALIQVANREFQNFNVAEICRTATDFIDDLSNWYIRRNRRRFWRSKDASDSDKRAAYQTLYEVLVTVAKLLAPCIPFVTERMYNNLVCHWAIDSQKSQSFQTLKSASSSQSNRAVPRQTASMGLVDGTLAFPESVHLCSYPEVDETKLDSDLNRGMAVAQMIVKLGHKLREDASLRVRQPLAELRFSCQNSDQKAAIQRLQDVIQEELNVKVITSCDNLDDLVSYTYKPNLKTLGPKYGKRLGEIREALQQHDQAVFAPLRRDETVTLEVNDEEVVLLPGDVLISTEQAADWKCADSGGLQIALSAALTSELQREGIRNDFVRHIQQLRKEANLEIESHIHVYYKSDDDNVSAAIAQWIDYIAEETLADSLQHMDTFVEGAKRVSISGGKLMIWLEKT